MKSNAYTLEEEQIEEIRELAEKTERTASAIVRIAVREYLEKQRSVKSEI